MLKIYLNHLKCFHTNDRFLAQVVFETKIFYKLFLRFSLVLSLPTVAPISWGPWFNELESTYPRMLPHKVKLFLPNGFKKKIFTRRFLKFSLYISLWKPPLKPKPYPWGPCFERIWIGSILPENAHVSAFLTKTFLWRKQIFSTIQIYIFF